MVRNNKIDEKLTLSYNAAYVLKSGNMFLMNKKSYIYIDTVYYDYDINHSRIKLLVCKTMEPKSKFVTINVNELGNTQVYIY